MKLCECGCGEPAPISKFTHARRGYVRGEPTRFISGHNHRGVTLSPETRARMSAYHATRPAEHHRNLVAARRRRPLGEAAGITIHQWLARNHPKSAVCEECGNAGKTDYAFLRHPEAYTRDRDDYREMCRSCHVRFDVKNGTRPNWKGIGNPKRQRKQTERAARETDPKWEAA